MSKFRDDMCLVQVDWRRRRLPHVSGKGWWKKHQYDHILPRAHQQENLWPGIQTKGRFPLDAYLQNNNIQAHTGRDNLLSSWTLAANLYFPFGQDADGRRLAAKFLRDYFDPAIASVRSVELEWAHKDPAFKPPTLLGETGGARGTHQTSPDVAFEVTLDGGAHGVVLTEVKFIEHNFYACSVRKRLDGAERAKTCHNLAALAKDPQGLCAQHTREGRRYWDHLRGAFNWTAPLRWCPAATAGYQLFRQQALAEGLAQNAGLGLVVSSLAYDERNGGLPGSCPGLVGSLHRTGVPDVRKDWSKLFPGGQAKFKVFAHQSWVRFVRCEPVRPAWCNGPKGWLAYVEDRYGL